jgi:hypothetical protein
MANTSKRSRRAAYMLPYITVKCKVCNKNIPVTLPRHTTTITWWLIHRNHKQYCSHCKRNVNIVPTTWEEC